MSPGIPLAKMPPTRASPGRIDLRIATTNSADSGKPNERPVTLPPGCLNDLAKPAPTGSDTPPATMGMVRVAAASAATRLAMKA